MGRHCSSTQRPNRWPQNRLPPQTPTPAPPCLQASDDCLIYIKLRPAGWRRRRSRYGAGEFSPAPFFGCRARLSESSCCGAGWYGRPCSKPEPGPRKAAVHWSGQGPISILESAFRTGLPDFLTRYFRLRKSRPQPACAWPIPERSPKPAAGVPKGLRHRADSSPRPAVVRLQPARCLTG